MDSLSKKQSLLSEDNHVNLSSFRRRNKILILILVFLIISLTVIIGALIISLIHHNTSSPYSINPAVGAFCMVSNDTPSCLSNFDPIISPKSRTDPNQIFALSLQTAAKELQNAISFISESDYSNTTVIMTFNNCSGSLRDGLSRIGDALGTMRVNPFVEMLGNERRVEMMKWIAAAEEDLRSCLDDLDEAAESTTAVTAKVLRVKGYVNNSQDYLREYRRVLEIFWSGIYSGQEMRLNLIAGNLFAGGVQWLFVLILFLILFRIR